MILLEWRPTGADRATGDVFKFQEATRTAKEASIRYAEECRNTRRIRYILVPLQKSWRCIEGTECYIVADWDSENEAWEIDQSQFEYVSLLGPMNSVGDLEEVLAAGEFHLLADYRSYLAMYFDIFLNAYSSQCRSHIRSPIQFHYAAVPGTRTVDSYGNVITEIAGLSAYSITIEASYERTLRDYHGEWADWAARNLGFDGVARIRNYVNYALADNCMDDRLQTIYKNMYNLAYRKPAIKGKYTTNIKRREPRAAQFSSAPGQTKAILAERERLASYNAKRTKNRSAKRSPMEFLTADGQVTAPPTAESTIGRPATDVDIDYVVSKMARTAGRLQATAEQCSGESEPEIRAEFVEASSNRFPDDIAAIEQAFDRHYEDRKSKLASKKKNRCRQKEHNRMNKENDFNVDLLAENSES